MLKDEVKTDASPNADDTPKTEFVKAELVDPEVVDESDARIPPKIERWSWTYSCVGCGCGSAAFLIILGIVLLLLVGLKVLTPWG